ncbi:MAG TPA: 16S rRNA (guanine(527)-N(7))-methyltransferase RsmG [Vicinamibacterales bacterium]|nr:16S rRNA (guanine(527)-N(7))-methyltransferase RsmG [Vicinamibacterales bacterium]
MRARVERAGGHVTPPALEAFETYFRLLARWNRAVNLTALSLDPLRDETVDRLFVEPIVAASHVVPAAGPASVTPVWLDLGSGGGSPAIPLKILWPDWLLTMVEARQRKAAFLREAVRVLGLSNAEVTNARFEDLSGFVGQADLVTVRAVKLDAKFAAAASSLLIESGRLVVFGAAKVVVPGFDVIRTVELCSPTVMTLLGRVPRGTNR